MIKLRWRPVPTAEERAQNLRKAVVDLTAVVMHQQDSIRLLTPSVTRMEDQKKILENADKSLAALERLLKAIEGL
jgi:hypothetical protein